MRGGDCPEIYDEGPPSRREESLGRGQRRGRFMCLGDVAQQYGRVSRLENSKGHSTLGHLTTRFYLINGQQMPGEVSQSKQSRQTLKD